MRQRKNLGNGSRCASCAAVLWLYISVKTFTCRISSFISGKFEFYDTNIDLRDLK